jgi:hypothetical protein
VDQSERASSNSASRFPFGGAPISIERAARDRRTAWAAAIVAALTVVMSLSWVILLVFAIVGVRSDVSQLRTLQAESHATVSPADVASASQSFALLHTNLTRIDRLTTLPPGMGSVVKRVPWLGPRYVAVRTMLKVGLHVSDAGTTGSKVASQSLAAYQSTGITQTAPAGTLTWLDVLGRNPAALDHVTSDISVARAEWATIDTSVLPGSLRQDVQTLDSAFARYDQSGMANSTGLPALMHGLGSDRPVRYLILFQNPAELRPSGGFPGTMALVTIDRGQLTSYRIFDAHMLTDDYIAHRTSKRPEPWPIDHYFPQDGFLLHDTGWYADFPRAASTMMSMYAETGWPPIDGVIAIQPPVVADLLQVTGPLDVEIDGELRHVTADNVYDEIERQRRLIVEGIKPWDKSREVHKEAVADIGEAIVEQLKNANQQQMVDAAKLLMKSAGVRDIQAYASDPALESLIDQHGWSGRLDPQPGTPTLAITFANVALQKTSEFMHPSLRLSASAVSDGLRTVTMDITVDNTGPTGEDPLYSGFQNWWIQVGLPDGARRVSSNMYLQPDPEAPNGGSYVVGINPQQARTLRVVFTLPADEPFLIRRQPGLTTASVVVDAASCGSQQFMLDRDRMVDLSGICRP